MTTQTMMIKSMITTATAVMAGMEVAPSICSGLCAADCGSCFSG